MTTFHVDLTQYVHRCPANPLPHVVQTHRTVVQKIDGGPCQKPYRVDGVDIACGAISVHDKQCPACKTQVIIRNTTTVDLGFQGPASEATRYLAAYVSKHFGEVGK